MSDDLLPGAEKRELGVLLKAARALRHQDRTDEAIAAYDDVVARFGGHQSVEVRLVVSGALFAKAELLTLKELPGRALCALEEVIRRYQGASEAQLRLHVVRAQFMKAWVYVRTGQLDEAINATEALVKLFTCEDEMAVVVQAGDLVQKAGLMLSSRSETEGALKCFRTLAERGQRATGFPLQKLAVEAQINAGMTLARLGKFEEAVEANEAVFAMGDPALEVLKEIGERAGNAESGAAAERVAWTMLARAAVFGQLHRKDEALTALDGLITRFEDGSSALMQAIVSMARRAREELLLANE